MHGRIRIFREGLMSNFLAYLLKVKRNRPLLVRIRVPCPKLCALPPARTDWLGSFVECVNSTLYAKKIEWSLAGEGHLGQRHTREGRFALPIPNGHAVDK